MSGIDVIYLPVTAKNNFIAKRYQRKIDIIYLMFPK